MDDNTLMDKVKKLRSLKDETLGTKRAYTKTLNEHREKFKSLQEQCMDDYGIALKDLPQSIETDKLQLEKLIDKAISEYKDLVKKDEDESKWFENWA